MVRDMGPPSQSSSSIHHHFHHGYKDDHRILREVFSLYGGGQGLGLGQGLRPGLRLGLWGEAGAGDICYVMLHVHVT